MHIFKEKSDTKQYFSEKVKQIQQRFPTTMRRKKDTISQTERKMRQPSSKAIVDKSFRQRPWMLNLNAHDNDSDMPWY